MIVLVTGVSGVGKTTVGRALAVALGWTFRDADDLHSAGSRERMRQGQPLTDDQRAPWLARVRAVMDEAAARGEHLVVACSALRAQYRDQLTRDIPDVFIVFLTAEPVVLRDRLARRPGHFAGPELLESQLATLEPPEHVLTLDSTIPVDALVDRIRAAAEGG